MQVRSLRWQICFSMTYSASALLLSTKLEWCQRPSSITSFKPGLSPCHYEELPRNHQVIYTRLRLGVTKLTHRHLFNKEDSPTCHVCNSNITLKHIFIHCQQYNEERESLLKPNKISDASLEKLLLPPIPPQCIIDFIKSIDLLSLI